MTNTSDAARALSSELSSKGLDCPVGAGDEELVVYAPNRSAERQVRVVVGGTYQDLPVRVVRSAPAKPAPRER